MSYPNRHFSKRMALQAIAQSRPMTQNEAAAYANRHQAVVVAKIVAAQGPTNTGTSDAPRYTKANMDSWIASGNFPA